MFRCFCGLVVVAFWSLNVLTVSAQEITAARHYGAGVHDFYQGRHFDAIRHFDLAVASNARDPRAYYFRGLAKRRLGWTADAEIDLRMASQLEVALKRRDVGLALQRIQGAERQMLERYRSEARQLPEAVVRNVIPQPARAIVQRPPQRRPARDVRAHYVPTELPSDATDPFTEQAAGLLGRGELQSPPSQVVAESATTAPFAADEEAADPFVDDFPSDSPFGTGVAGSAQGERESSPFAADDAATGPAPAATGGDGSSRGVFGAVLRALSRPFAPAAELAEQGGNLLEGARGAIPGGAAPATATPPDDATDNSFEEFPPAEDATEPEEAAEAPEATEDPAADDNPFDF